MSAPIGTLATGHALELVGFDKLLGPWHAECTCKWKSPEHDRLLPVSTAAAEHLHEVTR